MARSTAKSAAKAKVVPISDSVSVPDVAPGRENAWEGFEAGTWTKEINVRDFIHRNYTPYLGDSAFLAPATERTQQLWNQVLDLYKQEIAKGGVIDADTHVVGNIATHAPGYIDQGLEKIVGLQTDKPLKRAMMPFGGLIASVGFTSETTNGTSGSIRQHEECRDAGLVPVAELRARG